MLLQQSLAIALCFISYINGAFWSEEDLLAPSGFVYRNPTEFPAVSKNRFDDYSFYLFLVDRNLVVETEKFILQHFIDNLSNFYLAISEEHTKLAADRRFIELYDKSILSAVSYWKLENSYYKTVQSDEMLEKKSVASNTLKSKWSRYVWTKKEQFNINYSIDMPLNSAFLIFYCESASCYVDMNVMEDKVPQTIARFDVSNEGDVLIQNIPVYSFNTIERIFSKSLLVNMPHFDLHLVNFDTFDMDSLQANQGILTRDLKKYPFSLNEKSLAETAFPCLSGYNQKCHYVLYYKKMKRKLSFKRTLDVYRYCLQHESIYSNCVISCKGQRFCSLESLELSLGITINKKEI